MSAEPRVFHPVLRALRPGDIDGILKIELDNHGDNMRLARAWLPYMLVAGLLVLTRLPDLPIGAWLKSVRIAWDGILGTSISAATTPLYLPAAILIFVSALTILLHRMVSRILVLTDECRSLLSPGFLGALLKELRGSERPRQ